MVKRWKNLKTDEKIIAVFIILTVTISGLMGVMGVDEKWLRIFLLALMVSFGVTGIVLAIKSMD